MRNEEIRNVTGGKVMQSLKCNQQDLVVYFEFYRKPMEGFVCVQFCSCVLGSLSSSRSPL